MAQLGNHEQRVLLAQHLRPFLPPHWAVLVGGPREPFIQLEQDGLRDDEEPSLGSCCIVLVNAEDDNGKTYVAADLLQRDRTPEGTLSSINRGTVAAARGRGWRTRLGKALADQAVLADASVFGCGTDVIEE